MRINVVFGSFAVSAAASPTKFGHKECVETIERDVAVIGGGASGAHAAVWLRDAGYSVVVVEKAAQLVSYHTPS